MKSATTKILVFVIAVTLLTLVACSNRTAPSNSAEPPPQSESTAPPSSSFSSSESQSEAPQEESSAPNNSDDETVEAAFNIPIIGDMDINYGELAFAMQIPKIWAVAGMEILEGEIKIAEVTAQPISQYIGENGQEQNVFEAETDFKFGGENCVSSGNFAAGEYAGKYYHLQYEDGGTHNEVIYCLDTGDCLILVLFNLIEGTDVETQIEKFTAVTATIEISNA